MGRDWDTMVGQLLPRQQTEAQPAALEVSRGTVSRGTGILVRYGRFQPRVILMYVATALKPSDSHLRRHLR
jgi:hypothetical protein